MICLVFKRVLIYKYVDMIKYYELNFFYKYYYIYFVFMRGNVGMENVCIIFIDLISFEKESINSYLLL